MTRRLLRRAPGALLAATLLVAGPVSAQAPDGAPPSASPPGGETLFGSVDLVERDAVLLYDGKVWTGVPDLDSLGITAVLVEDGRIAGVFPTDPRRRPTRSARSSMPACRWRSAATGRWRRSTPGRRSTAR